MLEQVIHDTIRTLRVNLNNILYRGVQFTPLGSITANRNLRVIKSKDAQNALVMATVDNIRVLPGVVNHVEVQAKVHVLLDKGPRLRTVPVHLERRL
ncbi:hypothetical protein MT325_m469L [Paramecium bursaria chlorella virus MT325]|uniref:Uncharacterized protein m469L n=1 Tax=Paramecium bursaria Chlorella virus MT325 TaxID=346932 RepID=A7IUJ9_PBCVM|nr:hypothetical protein MT325_m469L [Paramecium bursaria chlorella virus MT325]